MAEYTIKEDGPNGSVEVREHDIVRRYKKRLGRDRKLEIPLHDVEKVHLDRRIGADEVVVKVRDAEYRWKIAGDGNAKRLVEEIEARTH